MSNFDQYENIENSGAIFYATDTFAFYANLDVLEDDPDFSTWTLNIAHDNFIIAYPNVGTLNQDFITGYEYRFWSSFTVPEGINAGCYYLIVLDGSHNVKYISNIIKAKETTDYTFKTRYRNGKNILNFNYEGLTAFYNQFRIGLVIRQPIPQSRNVGYDLIRGSFNPVRNVTGSEKQFITLWYNEGDHEAFSAASSHRVFEVAEDGQWVLYVRGESEYNIEWADNYPLAEGDIKLQKSATYKSNKLL